MDNIIVEVLNSLKEGTENSIGRYYSVYAGSVQENADPNNLWRLRVKVPSVYGDSTSDWALPRGTYNGNNYGFFALPQKDDNVWITFQNGDPRFPLWEYGAVATNEKPDNATGTKVLLKNPKGTRVLLQEDGTLNLANDDYSVRELMDELFDWLENAQVLTPSGLGKFSPDSVVLLLEIKAKIETILS